MGHNGNGQWQRVTARDVLFTRRYRIPCDSVLQMFNVSSEVKKDLSNRMIGFNENGKATLMASERKLQLMTCKENENSFTMTSVSSCIFCGNTFSR
jgi:hypothetical protein